MAWNDLSDTEHRLTMALRSFDWERVKAECQGLVDRLTSEPEPFPEDTARRLLSRLRRKCRFAEMGLLGEALLQSGLRTAQIRRQYGQALIDQGMLTGAELVLQSLISDKGIEEDEQGEVAEARGLIGRIYKQLYVNAKTKTPSHREQANLQRSLDAYSEAYASHPEKYTWQAINMVALMARAEADKVPLERTQDYKELATDILAIIARRERQAEEGLSAFDLATQMEADLALRQFDHAYRVARIYADAPNADAFEFGSTLRQLQEVWRLNNGEPPGSLLLPLLRAARLDKEGGGITVSLQEAQQDLAKGPELERVFGRDGSRTLKWYQQGLERAQAVCRIELADGRGFGTGWLVRSTDFFPHQPARPLVLTNAHVISETYDKAERPPHVWANFQLVGERVSIKSIVWSSPVGELDATLVDLAEDLHGEPMPLSTTAVQMADPGPRMYIIGHPGGRDLEFSLDDNRLVACNAEKLHYRTPTEQGSSGSPIFDPLGWQAVGLHHAGKAQMQKLGGPPGESYEANEGIAILAILQRTALVHKSS